MTPADARRSEASRPYREADPLGMLQSVHRARSRLGLTVLTAGMGLIASILPMAVGQRRIEYAVLAAVIGVVCVPLGLLRWLTDRRRARECRVELHEGGVVHHDRGVETRAAWNDVRAIHSSLGWARHGRARWTYALELADGRRHVLANDLEDYAMLTGAVWRAVQARVVEEAEVRLASNRTVAFGALTLGATGLELDGRTLAYEELRESRVEQDLLVLASVASRRWGAVPVARVPTHRAALELLRRRRRRADAR